MKAEITAPTALIQIVLDAKVCATPHEARHLFKIGMVRLGEQVISKPAYVVYPEDVPATLRVGKLHRIDLEGGNA